MAQIPLTGSIGVTGPFALLGFSNPEIVGNADLVLTVAQYSNLFIQVTSDGTSTAVRKVVVPVAEGEVFLVQNKTSEGFDIEVVGVSGAGVLVPPNTTLLVSCDGTNYSQPGGVSSGNLLVLQQGGTPGGNVYTSEVDLLAAANAIDGPVWIYVDGTFASNAPIWPAGTFAFTSPQVTLISQFPNRTAAVILHFANGCEISGVTGFNQIFLVNDGAGPIFSFAGAASITSRQGGFFTGGAAPLFEITGTGSLDFNAEDSTTIGSAGAVITAVGASALLRVTLGPNSIVQAGAITGPVPANLLVNIGASSASNSASGTTTVYIAQAANEGYNDTLVSPTLGAITVQTAIDDLKSRTSPWIAVAAGATANPASQPTTQFYAVDSSGAQSSIVLPATPVDGQVVVIKLAAPSVATPVLITAGAGTTVENPQNLGNFSAVAGTVSLAAQGACFGLKYQAANTRWIQERG